MEPSERHVSRHLHMKGVDGERVMSSRRETERDSLKFVGLNDYRRRGRILTVEGHDRWGNSGDGSRTPVVTWNHLPVA